MLDDPGAHHFVVVGLCNHQRIQLQARPSDLLATAAVGHLSWFDPTYFGHRLYAWCMRAAGLAHLCWLGVAANAAIVLLDVHRYAGRLYLLSRLAAGHGTANVRR